MHYIQTNARLVSIANTRAGRKLFFRLEKERQKLLSEGFHPTPKLLAARLDVPEGEVIELAGHIEAPEVSLDRLPLDEGPALADGLAKAEPSPEEIAAENEFRSVLGRLMEGFERTLADERERALWHEYVATDEPVPLSKLGERYGVSKQRRDKLRTGSRSGSALNFSHSSAPTPELRGYGTRPDTFEPSWVRSSFSAEPPSSLPRVHRRQLISPSACRVGSQVRSTSTSRRNKASCALQLSPLTLL